ncbi:hypothetical protein PISMIDRAFT_121391 [Pisolithus microcarpus 441]|uniref:Uncharacterized protein n=1 Tax=Pisolithus microcarpus 441 TaxID=765257 RepID=A0A0C9XIK1_9AGAM|nr:hypothetical protein BKA83DRAFT_121391 [Pisolithus microcarpus]KIK12150.1 hypothetical protein PISMIDRAFT_121391 [Pisolithus microcarpus 441]
MNEEKGQALASAFFPPPPLDSSVPLNYDYPIPVDTLDAIMEENINRNIARLSLYKAPGPDGISNSVLISCKV